MTLGEIERAVGEIIVTPQTAAIEEYVEVLLEEGVLVDRSQDQHFELTDDGRTLLEGVLASPST
jgi:predicted transcriptional regulator